MSKELVKVRAPKLGEKDAEGKTIQDTIPTIEFEVEVGENSADLVELWGDDVVFYLAKGYGIKQYQDVARGMMEEMDDNGECIHTTEDILAEVAAFIPQVRQRGGERMSDEAKAFKLLMQLPPELRAKVLANAQAKQEEDGIGHEELAEE